MKSNSLSWTSLNTLKKVSTAFKNNKLIVGTTDTVLGLFAPLTQEGFLALNTVKRRSGKPYLVLISSSACIKKYVTHKESVHIENIIKSLWPGPLTIIFKAKPGTPDYLVSEKGTIALRVPKHPEIQQLLQKTGPLFSTSANRAGQPIPERMEDVSPLIMKSAAYSVCGQGKNETTPSTIIDCSQGNVKIIREGAIATQRIHKFLYNNEV